METPITKGAKVKTKELIGNGYTEGIVDSFTFEGRKAYILTDNGMIVRHVDECTVI